MDIYKEKGDICLIFDYKVIEDFNIKKRKIYILNLKTNKSIPLFLINCIIAPMKTVGFIIKEKFQKRLILH